MKGKWLVKGAMSILARPENAQLLKVVVLKLLEQVVSQTDNELDDLLLDILEDQLGVTAEDEV